MKDGFTLIELIIVIVLIGILSIFIGPKIFTTGYKNKADVVKFITVVRYAQHESMIRGGGYYIGFNPNSYYVDNGTSKVVVPGEKSENIPVAKSISARYRNRAIDKVYFDYLGEPCKIWRGKLRPLTDFVYVDIDGQTVVISPYAGGVYSE